MKEKCFFVLNTVQINRFGRLFAEAELVVMDGNLPPESMKRICELSRANSVPGQYTLQFLG